MRFTADEILKYLANYRPSDEINRRAIEHICQEYGFSINFNHKGDKLEYLSFRTFERWLARDLFQPGEVIVIDEEKGQQLIILVKKAFPNHIIPEATLNTDNFLNVENKRIDFDGTYNEPTSSDLQRLQCSIFRNGLCWNGKYKELVAIKIPKDNTQVRITIVGRRVGIGVFKEINSAGEIVMYCVKMDDEEKVRYSMHEIVGPLSNFQLDTIFPAERKELADEFSYLNLIWNGHYKRVEPLKYKKRLKHYYFINSNFKVESSQDNDNTSDKKRHNRTNYFRKRSQAEEIIQLAITLQNKFSIVKVKTGQQYYYINHNFYIIKQQEKSSSSDNKRYVNKNYFNQYEQAEYILASILEKRKKQLVKN